ncbi:MAG: RNA polymerase sigma factor [Bacteroidaceae bacterium]|nr:RNA polymerase sigma factor [Bacteroidaceae bacterium]
MNQLEFERQYWPLRTRLMRTALALLGNWQEAEDAVQETFLRLWRQGERLDDMVSPEGFFLLTLRNHCLNLLRSRHPETVSLEESEVYGLSDELDTELREQLHADLRRLRLALATLKPKARSAITMQYFDDMTTRDIALVLGETPANTRSILTRARQQLRSYFHEHPDNP